ncbi:hypothetical protein RhiirC2_706433 [Rhizophagus irregularis]|uniref:Uncharacterized protein n=1 Tax=Rhizophagus irregularis TaxID=588596 RepID=A0A2N1NUV4_9GLOM|nr:hypothetical protein RhiirC2_706433 [Rhizophagus irregularis]
MEIKGGKLRLKEILSIDTYYKNFRSIKKLNINFVDQILTLDGRKKLFKMNKRIKELNGLKAYIYIDGSVINSGTENIADNWITTAKAETLAFLLALLAEIMIFQCWPELSHSFDEKIPLTMRKPSDL